MMLVSAVLMAASFPGLSVAAEPRPATGRVRILYAVPADREFRSDYRQAVEHAAADFRQWLRRELGGWTFQLYRATPEDCRLGEPSEYYARYSWSRVVAGVQHCAPVSPGSLSTVWVIYADVLHECGAPERLGAAQTGLTILPRQDLEGLIGNAIVGDCGDRWDLPVTRWIGGLGHELGHALGLPHPPGCEENAPSCDFNALMWAGYAAYPNTYLRDEEKEYLLESPFIGFEGVPNRPPEAVGALADRRLAGLSSTLDVDVSQAFVDPDGDPLTYDVSSSSPAVVAVQAAGGRVTLTAASAGTATVGVIATDPGGLSAAQSFRVTVASAPTPFTDDPIRPGVTPIRAIHFTELRERIDVLRSAGGLPQFSWSDPFLRVGATRVRLVHVLELRQALGAAYTAAGRPAPRWTDPAPVGGATPIRATHVTELRAAVVGLE